MQITPANSLDIPTLCGLLNVLFSQEADFKANYEAQSRGLSEIISDPQIGLILVARLGGQVVGMVNLLYTISTALGGRVALLEDMIVSPEARGSGVGSQLLKQAIEHARANGCKRITLLTDETNDLAQHFYQQHGFSFSAMIPLRLSLNE
jgi:ribosomal protein S18 acetylase RimI-like enzyme